MTTLADVTKEALSLSPEDRAVLVQRVWESIEHFGSPEVEAAWMAEVDRRWREIEEGKVQCLSADEAMKRVRESLGR